MVSAGRLGAAISHLALGCTDKTSWRCFSPELSCLCCHRGFSYITKDETQSRTGACPACFAKPVFLIQGMRLLPAQVDGFVISQVSCLCMQALRCISVYVGRILMALILSIIYGCTYVHLNTTDDGWYQRSTIFFIVCAVVPFLSITCLPVYDNLTKASPPPPPPSLPALPLLCPRRHTQQQVTEVG